MQIGCEDDSIRGTVVLQVMVCGTTYEHALRADALVQVYVNAVGANMKTFLPRSPRQSLLSFLHSFILPVPSPNPVDLQHGPVGESIILLLHSLANSPVTQSTWNIQDNETSVYDVSLILFSLIPPWYSS